MSLEAAVVRLAEAVEELSDALINRRWRDAPTRRDQRPAQRHEADGQNSATENAT